MISLELLAPARNAEIGIAAIDCGADAVYIAGPDFGARKDAGNPIEDLRPLCEHAHKFGAKIFVTFNISVRDEELPLMHERMLAAQEAGADAFIIRDTRACGWSDIGVPLHASTQCAIRTPEDARKYEAAGCRRLILERALSLEEVRRIREAVSCELEFFVHGAICVCYSGQCTLSEYLNGRSADRGECIQACRSLYDLVDSDGRTIVRNKALLSLKDFNLKERLEDLAEAGVCSFKIEGRLKNASYVRNVVLSYSRALDDLVGRFPDRYCRASCGRVDAGFEPDLEKTFNRGYTQYFIDGRRGKWSSADAPKSIGEPVGRIRSVRAARSGRGFELLLDLLPGVVLANGDGFAFGGQTGVKGFRGDVCEGARIVCNSGTPDGFKPGMMLHRNISSAFEKTLERPSRREMDVEIDVHIHGRYDIDLTARSEDGREIVSPFKADVDAAENREREEAVIREGLSKRTEHYRCRVGRFIVDSGTLPLLSSSTVNLMRRAAVSDLDSLPVGGAAVPVVGADSGVDPDSADSVGVVGQCSGGRLVSGADFLMRTRYCIRYELGMCPVHQGAKPSGPLFLLNNGRRFALDFNCRDCEMYVRVENDTK